MKGNEKKMTFLTDMEIASQAEMRPIKDVAHALELHEDDYDLYGKSYMSLIPTSPLYKRRLSLYDIKKVI